MGADAAIHLEVVPTNGSARAEEWICHIDAYRGGDKCRETMSAEATWFLESIHSAVSPDLSSPAMEKGVAIQRAFVLLTNFPSDY